ncbi:MAG TPA: hypothetical protein VG223_14305, partial [Solirubrobacteraceae bacterium]|nr:hypothetical protein [Solirubrobacteraceae bacterium]
MSQLSSAELTRRSLLAGAAAGASSLVAAPGVRAAPAAVFGLPVGALHGVSAVIPVRRSFALVGVQWRGARRARIELRARLAAGGWSRWVNASVAGHGPDRPRHVDLNLGEPLWSGGADAVQLRSAAPVSGVRLQFVAGAEITARLASAFPQAEPQLPAGPGQPPIIARAAWAHGHAPPKYPPAYGDVRLGFVHHTDNLNGYGAGEVASMIHNIYLYHRYSNGWNDIGYNFVIDAFGR